MFKDKRSGKFALVAHCILNQNSRVLGLAERTSVIMEILEFLMDKGLGIIQMPCPELTYAGILRQSRTKDQYDNTMFRRYCRGIAEEIVDHIQEYSKCGINAKIVIGVDGSPSCGVNGTSKETVCENLSRHEKVKGSGVLIEELQSALKKKKISIPFHGITYERLREDLAKIEKLLEG